MAGEHCYLGIEDGEVSAKDLHHLDYTCNIIGGKPLYPPNINEFNPKCILCHQELNLLVQIYAPLENSNYHRTLYVFCCPSKKCWKNCDSWQCYRIQYIGEINAKNTTENAASSWLENADNWDEAEIETEKFIFNSKEKSLGPHWHSDEDKDDHSFKCFHIAVIEENNPKTENCSSSTRNDTSEPKLTGEKYEKSHPKHGDTYFWSMFKKLQSCPNQLIRYRGNNCSPLFFFEPILPLSCKYCGGSVSYELQLLPTLMSKLIHSDGSEMDLDYCTIIVMSCSTSCWEETDMFREEQLIVQFERPSNLNTLL